MHMAGNNMQGYMREKSSGQITFVEESICKSFYYYLIGKINSLLDVESVANKINEINQKNYYGIISMYAGMILDLDEDHLKLVIEEPLLNSGGGRGYQRNIIKINLSGEIELLSYKKIRSKNRVETGFYETCGYSKEKLDCLASYLQALYCEYLKFTFKNENSHKL